MPITQEDSKAKRYYKISNRLRFCRKYFKMTQKALAEKSGLTQSRISQMENGRCTVEEALKVSMALKIQGYKLIDHEGETDSDIEMQIFGKSRNGFYKHLISVPVGARLRQIRIERGLSQEDIAVILNVKQVTVSSMERGAGLRPRYIRELAEWYRMSEEELTGGLIKD